jgi:hypothetical protein
MGQTFILIIFGLWVIISGKIKLSKNLSFDSYQARLFGLAFVISIVPISIAIDFLISKVFISNENSGSIWRVVIHYIFLISYVILLTIPFLKYKKMSERSKSKRLSLNHPKVSPITFEIALSLKLEPSFLAFIFAEQRPECFQNWCEIGGWTCFVPDNFEIAYPIWSTNSDQILILISNGLISYGKGYHDCNEIEMISKTSQGLLAYLLVQI